MKAYVVALLLVVGILGGFYGGYKIGNHNVSASTTGQTQNTRGGGNLAGGGFGGGRGGGGGAVCPSPGAPTPSPGSRAVATGAITGLTSTSLTITNPSCEVKVTFGSTVQISRQVAGNTSDLKDNLTVTIIGTRQSDGSIKATAIQIGGNTFSIGGNQSPPPSGG